MGLAASQARLLLLTAKNDKLELQAQQIETERLLLAQEQETIANEYSEATTNTIYTCKVYEDGETQQQTLTLDSLAKSMTAGAGSATIIIADSNGNPLVKATATYDSENGTYKMTYQVCSDDGEWSDKTSDTSDYAILENLNINGSETTLQYGLSSGSLQLWVWDEDVANDESTGLDANDGKTTGWVRKSTESLSSVTSRYYTEDDAAAQAVYNAAMAKVNAMDTKLENRLNQIETQKTAVEQEMESVDSIISSNIERTFEYFS